MKKILKIITPPIILSFLIWTIVGNWSLVGEKISSANITLFLASLLILSLTYVGGAFFWYKILQAISFKTTFKEAFRVFIISNFGRFIPGVVLHYVARVYLSKGLGLGVGKGMSAVFLEAYYTLAGAAVVSILAFPVASRFINATWLLFSATVVLAVIIFFRPVKLFIMLKKAPFFGKYIPKVIYKNDLKEHLSLLGLSASLFLLYGIGFFLLSSAFVSNPLSRVLDISGLLSASWIIGFVTPVAPGGLGVSDLSFAFLLQFFYDFSLASFLALAFRFSLFIAEGLMFFLVVKLTGLNVLGIIKTNK